ncbi:MAG: PAS domain S-box protein, partial [Thermodesulfobacteriota bacterium]|nr:PAS domain S-box protein [Thermodesulfobacteriota bacterium]
MMRSYDYILKAVETFARRFAVISRDYRVRAVVGPFVPLGPEEMIGKLCYEVLRGLDGPCDDCALAQVFSTGRPAVRRADMCGPNNRETVLRHFFPIYDGDDITAAAVLDLDLESLGGPDTELSGADPFLNNLIMSSVDGIIASDMTGKILIFNEAASEITGYDHREALGELDIRDIYPGDGAREVMRLLRSDEYGGKGKLRSYRVDLLRKDGTTVPINLSVAVVYDCGREAATVGFFYDLRQKIRMEEELQKAQVQLVQAEK